MVCICLSAHVEVRRQPESLLSPHGFQRLKSGHQIGWQAHLPLEHITGSQTLFWVEFLIEYHSLFLKSWSKKYNKHDAFNLYKKEFNKTCWSWFLSFSNGFALSRPHLLQLSMIVKLLCTSTKLLQLALEDERVKWLISMEY